MKTAKPTKLLKQPQGLLLVYAGTFAVFRIKEFDDMKDLGSFITRNKLGRDDYAIIEGVVAHVSPAYRDRKSALYDDSASDDLTDQRPLRRM